MVINPHLIVRGCSENGLAHVWIAGKDAYLTKTGAFVVDPFPRDGLSAKERARLAAEAFSPNRCRCSGWASYSQEFLGTWTDRDNRSLLELSYVDRRINQGMLRSRRD